MRYFFYLALLFFLAAAPARAITVSDNVVDIGLNFGNKLLLVEGKVDSPNQEVVITLKGPDMAVNLWQKKRFLGIWVNGVKKTFTAIPSFYFWAATDDKAINYLSDWQKYSFLLGDDSLTHNFYDQLKDSNDVKKTYSDGLMQSLTTKKMYFPDPDRIYTQKDSFYLPIDIYPEAPAGVYHLTAYYLDGWHITRTEQLVIEVKKYGLNSAISNFAEKNSLLYGVIAIIMAFGFGYLSSVVYNKIILPRKNKLDQKKLSSKKK